MRQSITTTHPSPERPLFTRFDQLRAAFPAHWCAILQYMDNRTRNMYLVADADPRGAGWALGGAFIWERSEEGHAFWAGLARQAEQVAA